METAALMRDARPDNAPPPRLERLVLLLIPPQAREAVVGDLCETYRAPAAFLREALAILPFVIASQMRRNLNLPLFGLQGFLVFFLLGGWTGARHTALVPTSLAMLLSMLRSAYQPTERQPCHRAMATAVLLLLGMFVAAQLTSLGAAMIERRADDLLWLQFSFFAPFLFPLLCLFRAGLILDGDWRAPFVQDELSEKTLREEYRRFTRRVLWCNRAEAGAFAAAAILVFQAAASIVPPAIIAAAASVYGVVAIFLLFDAPAPADGADFLSLRAAYQQALIRRQQLRRFLWWLWFAPVLVALRLWLIEAGFATGRSILIVCGAVACVLLCFAISALNRELGGRVQEKIAVLGRIRQG